MTLRRRWAQRIPTIGIRLQFKHAYIVKENELKPHSKSFNLIK